MVSQRAEPSRWRQNEMDTAASRTFLFLAHTAKANQNKPHLKIWPRKRQVPTGSTSYVGTCSPTSVQCKIQPLQRSESVLTCFTTPLWSIKYLHVPLELRDFALFGGLETWSIPIWHEIARGTEVFLLLNRGILNCGIQGVRKNEKMQGWGRF